MTGCVGEGIASTIMWQYGLIKLFIFYLSDAFKIFNPTLLKSPRWIDFHFLKYKTSIIIMTNM